MPIDVVEHGSVIEHLPEELAPAWVDLWRYLLVKEHTARTAEERLYYVAQLLKTPAIALARVRGGRRYISTLRTQILKATAECQVNAAPAHEPARVDPPRERRPPRPAANRAEEDKKRIQRAITHLKYGKVRKAMQALQDTKIADAARPEVLAKLRELHPPARHGQAPRQLPQPPAAPERVRLSPESEELQKMLIDWCSTGSAGGPSALTGSMLIPIIRDPVCRPPLFALLERIRNGDLDAATSRLLLSSRVVPIEKPNGGIRPVAIGEMLVRLASRHAMETIAGAATKYFGDIQLGCGATGGAQVASQVMLGVLLSDRNAGRGDNAPAAFLIDVANAFPEADRLPMLNNLYEVQAFAPVWNMVYWLLSTDAPLFVVRDGQVMDTVSRQRGVPQGDPLSAFLFCLGIHKEFKQAMEAAPRNAAVGVGFCDNLGAVGEASAVTAVGARLIQLLSARGDLRLNRSQTKILFLRDLDPPDTLSDAAREYGADIVSGHSVLKTLGVVFGANVADVSAAEVARMRKYLEKCRLLEDKTLPIQDVMLLLRYCVGAQPTHTLRGAYPDTTHEAVAMLDDFAAKIFFERVLDTDPSTLTPERRDELLLQARLPCRPGYPGLGLPAPSQQQSAAFFAGVVQAAPLLGRAGVLPWVRENSRLRRALHDAVQIEELREPAEPAKKILPPKVDGQRAEEHLSVENVISFFAQKTNANKARHAMQKTLTHDAHARRRTRLYRLIPAIRLALYKAVSQKGCARWLTTLPDCADTTLTDEEYITACLIHLGFLPGVAPEFKDLAGHLHCTCQAKVTLADAPFHLLNCKSGMRQAVLRRHNAIVRTTVEFMRRAGLLTEMHANAYDNFTKRNPDLTIYRAGGVLLLDVTLRNPLAACRPRLARPLSFCVPSALALSRAEDEKKKKYRDMESKEVTIHGMAFTCFGATSKYAQKVMNFQHLPGGELQIPSYVDARRLKDKFRRSVSCIIAKSSHDIMSSAGLVYHGDNAAEHLANHGPHEEHDYEFDEEKAADDELRAADHQRGEGGAEAAPAAEAPGEGGAEAADIAAEAQVGGGLRAAAAHPDAAARPRGGPGQGHGGEGAEAAVIAAEAQVGGGLRAAAAHLDAAARPRGELGQEGGQLDQVDQQAAQGLDDIVDDDPSSGEDSDDEDADD
jgi:hypothetical protein